MVSAQSACYSRVMVKIRISAEDLRDPFKSRVLNCRIEQAIECDGLVCGIWNSTIGDEAPPEIDPHFHLVVWGEDPQTSARYIPFFGNPPETARFVSFGPE